MVTISKYYSSVTKKGVKPSNPGNVVTVIPEVLNPADSPVSHSPVTIGSPANGLSLAGQVLSLNPNDIGAVLITGTQTITGAKTFDNSLLVLSGTSPIFRIAGNGNVSTLNFRANSNEEKATLQYSDVTNAFSIATRVNNSDISITPHGTGKIKLSNVPSGTGDVLMRDASNNLVRGSGSLVTQTKVSFAPSLIDSGGSATYTYSSYFAEYVKTGNTITFEIRFLGVNSSGTPSGQYLWITPMDFAIDPSARFSFSFSQFTGSSYSSAQLGDVIGVLVEQIIFVTTLNGSISVAPTFSSGTVRISGTYYI